MNLFVWNHLKDRKMLSFVLRRKYQEPLEPAILKGWMPGINYPDMLFQMGNHYIDADLVPDLSREDFMILDGYHAVGDGVHKRIMVKVSVMRFGKIQEVPAYTYVCGRQFSKLQGVSMR